MKKSKTQKGITLIALIITIVVLLILAVVAISSIQNDGILSYANNAVISYNQAQKNEQDILDGYLEKIPGNGGSSDSGMITVAEAQTKGILSSNVNTDVVDEYGNKIVVPAGFKITTDANNVTEGIVIEDCTETATKGSQFVWIAVGDVKHLDTEGNKTTTHITLGRYLGFGTTATPTQSAENENYTKVVEMVSGNYNNFIEEQPTASGVGTYGNSIARNINDFCKSALTNGGYYIGRYEAGDAVATASNTERTSSTSDENTMVCKSNQQIYTYVTQPQAANLSKAMYKDGFATGTFSSDLVNSYAWDTAIIFIQKFRRSK